MCEAFISGVSPPPAAPSPGSPLIYVLHTVITLAYCAARRAPGASSLRALRHAGRRTRSKTTACRVHTHSARSNTAAHVFSITARRRLLSRSRRAASKASYEERRHKHEAVLSGDEEALRQGPGLPLLCFRGHSIPQGERRQLQQEVQLEGSMTESQAAGPVQIRRTRRPAGSQNFSSFRGPSCHFAEVRSCVVS